jgi:ABC-type dipeptide/oligopeptide/nickel transport system permease component
MVRWLIVEALRAAFSLFVVSVLAFIALDATGEHDWYATLAPGRSFGMASHESLGRSLPRLYFRDVDDAQVRTLSDLQKLTVPQHRQGARDRLLSRGAVVVPTALAAFDSLSPAAKTETLALLAMLAPALTGGERPPADPVQARAWWDSFRVMHEIDLRDAYARRHVQRLADHDSPNAREQLERLGTLALPALFEALDAELDAASARRLCALASDLTGNRHRIPPSANADQTRAIVEGWRAWWFANHLDYVRLGQTRRWLGKVTEARYGLWLGRAFDGRMGPSRVTRRSVLTELRERLPASTVLAGLGGLVATALVVAFGGGPALRQRPLRTKLVDLVAAFVPGLAAFSVGFLALCSVCAGRASTWEFAKQTLSDWPRLLLGIALVTGPAALFLRRERARVVLQAVRAEAESWAEESKTPHPAQLVRHGARVGVASLLAPAALNALVILTLTLLVEPIARVHGMGELTLRSLLVLDGVWLQIAVLSIVPLAIGTRWARTALVWALGGKRAVFPAPTRAKSA